MEIEANYVDILNRQIFPAKVTIKDSYISSIEKIDTACKYYILPGFIDSHIHIESAMLPPTEFARLAVCHGTIATISDPHEIANVLGVSGVEFMLNNSKKTPFKFYFGAPSCVPATIFETNGATLGPREIENLLKNPKIKYLSEVMNFPGVIQKNSDILAKIELAKKFGKVIDGHAPGLYGEDLQSYINAGITTDHEAFSYQEGLEKIQRGMKIQIREGSAAKNFEELSPLIALHPNMLMFCSDDRHPDDLVQEHINGLVKRAIAKGYNLFDVLRIASLNPIEHYGLEVGLLRIGDPADFIIVEDLKDFHVQQTVIEGNIVTQNGSCTLDFIPSYPPNFFHTKVKDEIDFQCDKNTQTEIIHAIDHELITKREPANIKDNDILKIAVINRYKNVAPALAYVRGFGLKKGAIASSIAHDSHNIIAVGCSDKLITKAVNTIIESQGGISVVTEDIIEHLELPIAGLMSNKSGNEVAVHYAKLNHIVKTILGSTLSAPFMTLSFMALLVIPELKLSDKGLFDSIHFRLID